ncbi:type I phosphomannose isomerase catalytic subunit, partial [Streptomyces sp. PGLac3x]
MDRLQNTVRPYAWGSVTAIPHLTGAEPTGEPQAELWMGAHPGAPSLVDRGTGPRSLADLIAADPDRELGPAVAARF